MQTRRHFSTPLLRDLLLSERSKCLALGLLLAACVTEDVDPEGLGGQSGAMGNGASNQGGGGATGGSTSGGAGGTASGGYRDDPLFASGVRCPPLTQALLTDFTLPVAAPVGDAGADAAVGDAAAPTTGGVVPPVGFGDFTATFSGSPFIYPGDGDWPIVQDGSQNNWHITGNIGAYSGFGLSFFNCYAVDASMYDGLQFTISGSIGMGTTITLSVGTTENDVSHLWLNDNAMPIPNPPLVANAGECIPAATQYDTTCSAPSFQVPITAEPTVITVPWASLVGGRPAATVNPAELTNISWSFPAPPGVGTAAATAYPVDLIVDNIQFANIP